MSLIIGIKKDGAFYLGADTQTTNGDLIERDFSKEGFKIKDAGNGLLFCAVGACDVSRNIIVRDELFVLPEDGLTKRFIVENFVPKVFELIKEEGLVSEIKEGKPNIDCTFALVYKDKCFIIKNDLSVWEVDEMFAIGSGKPMAFAFLQLSDDKQDVKKTIIDAMKASAESVTSVSAPYILRSSNNPEYEIIEG